MPLQELDIYQLFYETVTLSSSSPTTIESQFDTHQGPVVIPRHQDSQNDIGVQKNLTILHKSHVWKWYDL